MTLATADRIVFLWAHKNNYDCDFQNTDRALAPCMRVQLKHAAAYFRDGRLVRLDTRCDGRFSNELASELANLFALCGHLELRRTNAGIERDRYTEQAGAAFAEPTFSNRPPRRNPTGFARVRPPRLPARQMP